MAWSEDRLHAWLARRPRPANLSGSAGHDAAVLRHLGGRPVVCTDACIAGVHYEPGEAPSRVGTKAAHRSLSDLAATAARPHALALALRAPAETSERRLRDLIAAVDRAGVRCGAPLAAGDLSLAPGPEGLTVTALGAFPGRGRPPGRDRIEPGDRLFATGSFGGSRLGRHLRFVPRLEAGQRLAEAGARALMDVSDGLALDLYRLARSSGVQLCLQELPIHRDAQRAARQDGRSALDHALHDGEDHELLVAAPARRVDDLMQAARAHRFALLPLGVAQPGRGLVLDLADYQGPWTPDQGGWLHGR